MTICLYNQDHAPINSITKNHPQLVELWLYPKFKDPILTSIASAVVRKADFRAYHSFLSCETATLTGCEPIATIIRKAATMVRICNANKRKLLGPVGVAAPTKIRRTVPQHAGSKMNLIKILNDSACPTQTIYRNVRSQNSRTKDKSVKCNRQ
jgi:hypothetical protein